MNKFMCTAAAVAFSLFATAQEKADSAKIDILLLPNVELNEVNVLGTWAQKNDPIAQINLTEKDIEALNTGRDLPYVDETVGRHHVAVTVLPANQRLSRHDRTGK